MESFIAWLQSVYTVVCDVYGYRMVTGMKTESIRGDWQGQVIDGRYPLLQWLGGSELSGVFLTELPGDHLQKAAIRLVMVDGAEADAQLARWTAASDLSHPHLMRLLHAGRCQIGNDRLIYAVTEYADEKLSEILPERALTAAEAREMVGPVLDALVYLHGKGLVHGRLKPSKIMVVNDQVKLTVADVQAAGKLERLGEANDVHDAPECAAGTISQASDIWSLGVTLVEALTQHLPVLWKTPQSDPVVPKSMAEPFAGIAREALRLDPAQRCSLGDVRDRLNGIGPQRKMPATEAARQPVGTHKPALIAAAVVLVAIAGAYVVRLNQTPASQVTTEEPREAAIAKPSASTPASGRRSSKPATATVTAHSNNAAIVEQVMPDLLPRAVASIHGQVNVKVRVAVDATGAVSNATLESPGPSKYFANAALDAARRWRFKAAQAKGQAVASVWMLQFKFTQSGTDVTPVEVTP
jgi:TonB family protein